MEKQTIKQRVLAAIDQEKDRLIALTERLWKHPELGYKESFGTKVVADFLRDLGMEPEENIAITGCSAEIEGSDQGPVIAVLGELDAIVSPEHPAADPATGAVHACGHHLQVAAMAGVAQGLVASGAMNELSGRVRFMAVPAEEYVELGFRSKLREEKKISYYGGKQELIAKGFFDDVNISMMIHSLSLPKGKRVLISSSSLSFVGKEIRFIGKEVQAASEPEKGVNALNAAVIAMNAIHVQRETFMDKDSVRIHPIITKGGDIVNNVPADVRMETYVRARSVQAMLDANRKADRALKAGAIAVGAEVEIQDTPGYLSLLNNLELEALFRSNAVELIGEAAIVDGGDVRVSTDFGDISQLIPSIHPYIGGVEAPLHTREFQVTDIETACIIPAKLMAATIVDLLADNAKEGRTICKNFRPAMTKEEYMKLLEKLTCLTRF